MTVQLAGCATEPSGFRKSVNSMRDDVCLFAFMLLVPALFGTGFVIGLFAPNEPKRDGLMPVDRRMVNKTKGQL